MKSRAWSPAVPKFSAPASIFPIPTGLKRSTPSAQSLSPCSFDVLHLLPEFFDVGLDLQREPHNGQRFRFHARSFREHGVGFAVHLLQKKIELLALFACAI